MIKALYASASGMKAQQRHVDVIANNIANVNTGGFKKSRVDFQDLLYETIRRPGAGGAAANALGPPSGLQVGSGTDVISTTKNFSQGSVEGTGNALDIAIEGSGFFQVQLPDGTIGYTRAGSFQMDSTGRLVTAQGYPLEPQVTLQQFSVEGSDVAIEADGRVMLRQLGQENFQQVTQIQISTFLNPAGLDSIGSNVFKATDASGAPQPQNPGTQGAGNLRQFALERSNVDIVQELIGLITAQRAYELNSRAIRSADGMLSQLQTIIR
ncbi:MAG: flagellar basal-body rod protein FlgG [Planctomycetota bacterium]